MDDFDFLDDDKETKRALEVSIADAIEWYNSNDPFKKDLAQKLYSEYELTGDILPKSYEDFVKKFNTYNGDAILTDYGSIESCEKYFKKSKRENKECINAIPSKDMAKGIQSYIKLLQLERSYNGEDWKPDSSRSVENKWGLYFYNSEWLVRKKDEGMPCAMFYFRKSNLAYKFKRRFAEELDDVKKYLLWRL